jgi:ABC-type glycerol-3-phosphate transport system substrate-binding protein
MRTQMINAIQSKNPVFDVYQIDEPWTGQTYDNGWVRPLDEILPGYKIDTNIIQYENLPFWDKATRSASPQGRVMGLPINGNLDLFVYRKDLYEKLGLSVPSTWDEAIENGRRGMKANAAKYGYVARGQPTTGGQSISYDFMPVFFSYGADWFTGDDAKLKAAVNSDAAKAATDMYRRLLEMGPPRPQTVGQADVIGLFQSGQALQGHFVAAGAAQLDDPSRSSVVGKCGFAALPAGPKGSAPTSGVWSLCVPADQTEERQKAAAEFITWVLEKEQQINFARAGGLPTRSDAYADATGQAAAYLKAVADSVPHIRGSVRYVFAAPMLEAVEPALAQMCSGELPIESGLDALQAQLIKIAKDAGFSG